MKMEKVGNVLDLIVFLAAAPSLVVIFWSLIWFPPLYSLSSWWLYSWSTSFHFNTKLGIVVINLEEIGGVWSSFYWYAIFKMIWTNLGAFPHLECFRFSRSIYKNSVYKLCPGFYFIFILWREKNAFAKIDPILKYVSPNGASVIYPILQRLYLWSKKHKDNYPLNWNIREYYKNTLAHQEIWPLDIQQSLARKM